MEHTLGEIYYCSLEINKRVLILVLMEHTLGGYVVDEETGEYVIGVLILVLMEHTLGVTDIYNTKYDNKS